MRPVLHVVQVGVEEGDHEARLNLDIGVEAVGS